MSSSLPIVKFISLAVRQLSQPLANKIKNKARSSLFFRTYICMPPAQLYHWMEVSYKRKVFHFASRERSKPVEKLNEKAAIELGAELLGESIIFVVAVVTITLEFTRQQRKASKEAAVIETRWNETESRICSLEENIKETSENLNRILEVMKSQDQAKLKTLLPLLEEFNKRL